MCESVWGYGHDWISLIHLVSHQELCVFNLLRELVVVLIHPVQQHMLTLTDRKHSKLKGAIIKKMEIIEIN